jgi:ElaB/YqjD/DUF883 family membrane-anchored ribosome-binding protein
LDYNQSNMKKVIDKVKKKDESFQKKQRKKLSDLRKVAQAEVDKARKRIKRLEQNDLTDSPAYRKWVESGGEPFSIKGKDYNGIQKELARIRQFTNAETSLVRGVNNVLKEMAKNTGIKYKNVKELQAQSRKFFELASKVEQYLRTVQDIASAIGYQKIWKAINKYVETEKINLANAENDVDGMVHAVVEAINTYGEKEPFSVKGAGFDMEGYFILEDE